MGKLACVGVDLGGLRHHCRLHGLDERNLPPAGATAVGRRAVERFTELFGRLHVRATFFAVGEELDDGPSAMALGEASRLGHEIGNHSHTHDPGLFRRPEAEVARELHRAADAIEAICGRRPVGFRAPGHATSGTLLSALEEQGYLYDSSVLPSGPVDAAKTWARRGLARLGLGPSSSPIGGGPAAPRAPRHPYHPDPRDPYRRGAAKLIELPATRIPGHRLPFIDTLPPALPGTVAAGRYRWIRHRNFLDLQLDGIDLLDETDGASAELATARRDLRVPAGMKRRRLAELFERIRDDFEWVTLEEAARRLVASSS